MFKLLCCDVHIGFELELPSTRLKGFGTQTIHDETIVVACALDTTISEADLFKILTRYIIEQNPELTHINFTIKIGEAGFPLSRPAQPDDVLHITVQFSLGDPDNLEAHQAARKALAVN